MTQVSPRPKIFTPPSVRNPVVPVAITHPDGGTVTVCSRCSYETFSLEPGYAGVLECCATLRHECPRHQCNRYVNRS
jgi:hypothetical protein